MPINQTMKLWNTLFKEHESSVKVTYIEIHLVLKKNALEWDIHDVLCVSGLVIRRDVEKRKCKFISGTENMAYLFTGEVSPSLSKQQSALHLPRFRMLFFTYVCIIMTY